MKNITTKILLLALVTVMTASCKKDAPDGPTNGKPGSMTMKVDGAPWSSTLAHVLTVSDEESETENFIVTIQGITAENEEDGDALSIMLSLPPEKFNNPKGTYDILALDSDPENRTLVYSMFYKLLGGNTQQVYAIPEANKSIGKLTITDFKIGQQTFLGQVIGGKGYTHLKGTFQMELTELKMDGKGFGGTIALTEGKFDVKNQLNF